MTATPIAPPDASALAAEVRQIALLAHRMLNDPSASIDELRDLSARVARLRRQARGRQSVSVARWLDRLNERLAVEPVA